jgi:hypothetical protein
LLELFAIAPPTAEAATPLAEESSEAVVELELEELDFEQAMRFEITTKRAI